MNGVAGLLLAAGRGTRFGGNKLKADLAGEPLANHAARTMALLGLPLLLAVVAGGVPPPGFSAVANPDPAAGQGRSLALGITAARRAGAEAVLVMLADMPFVSTGHLRRLLACHEGADTLAASGEGDRRMPPALLGRAWFGPLEEGSGDQGARAWLGAARIVPATADELIDIDRPDDLIAARAHFDRGRSGASGGPPRGDGG